MHVFAKRVVKIWCSLQPLCSLLNTISKDRKYNQDRRTCGTEIQVLFHLNSIQCYK